MNWETVVMLASAGSLVVTGAVVMLTKLFSKPNGGDRGHEMLIAIKYELQAIRDAQTRQASMLDAMHKRLTAHGIKISYEE